MFLYHDKTMSQFHTAWSLYHTLQTNHYYENKQV